MVNRHELTTLNGKGRGAAAAPGTARFLLNEALDTRDALIRVAGALCRAGDRDWAAMALIAIERLRPLYMETREDLKQPLQRTITATYFNGR